MARDFYMLFLKWRSFHEYMNMSMVIVLVTREDWDALMPYSAILVGNKHEPTHENYHKLEHSFAKKLKLTTWHQHSYARSTIHHFLNPSITYIAYIENMHSLIPKFVHISGPVSRSNAWFSLSPMMLLYMIHHECLEQDNIAVTQSINCRWKMCY